MCHMQRNILAIALSVLVAGATANAEIIITSTFDTDVDGWAKLPGADASSSVQWISSGGNPGGFMRYNEVGAGFIDYVVAPSKFLGDRSLLYGGTFSFDITTNIISSPTNRNDQVRFLGGGLGIRRQLPNPIVGVWSYRLLELTDTGGWISEVTNAAATELEIMTVLGNLTGIHLLTDYRSGSEQPSFDNIRLYTPIPEPNSASLTVLAAAVIMRHRRRH